MPSPVPEILAVRFSSLGDLILATPLIRAIKTRHPAAQVTLVTRREYAPLFAHNPRITRVVAWDPATSLRTLAADLRGTSWTHRLDLHGSLRSLWLRRLVGGRWGTYPKHRWARTILIRTKRNVYRDHRPVAERYFDAARGLDLAPDALPPEVFVSMESNASAERFLQERGLGFGRTLIALVPGAAHATKEWPEHHWSGLVQLLAQQPVDLVVVGGSRETALAGRLAAIAGPRAVSSAGRFDVEGTAALLKRARCVIAGDTGVMHLATAVGTPVIALYGPTVAAFGFRPYHARATVLERDLPCRPCSKMGGPVCPLSHHRCLDLITPAEVHEALRRLPQ